MTYLGSC